MPEYDRPADTSAISVVRAFLDAWADRDAGRVVNFFATDAVFVASVGPEPGRSYSGHSEIGPAVEVMLATAAGSKFAARELIPFDGGVVATWSVTGPDGQIALGIDIFGVRGGSIVLKDAYRKVAG